MFGMTPVPKNTIIWPDSPVKQEIAAFLLMRGPYAYIGYGTWGMTWPVGVSFLHTNHTSPLPLPKYMREDYGVPLGLCSEVSDGVFKREFSKSMITLDCNKFEASLENDFY